MINPNIFLMVIPFLTAVVFHEVSERENITPHNLKQRLHYNTERLHSSIGYMTLLEFYEKELKKTREIT